MLSQPVFMSIYAAYPAALAWAGRGSAWAARELRPGRHPPEPGPMAAR